MYGYRKLTWVACLLPALGVVLAGCGVLKPSRAWSVATSLDVPGKGDYDESSAYAKGVSRELSRQGIPNKLVTFHYTVCDKYEVPHVITRSSVLYRDESQKAYPWWLMDNMVRLPVWLPNASLADQVHFVTRYNPEIIDVKEGKLAGETATPTAIVTVVAAPPGSASKPVLSEDKKDAALFYKENGTPYDPSSSIDRRKMEALIRQR